MVKFRRFTSRIGIVVVAVILSVSLFNLSSPIELVAQEQTEMNPFDFPRPDKPPCYEEN